MKIKYAFFTMLMASFTTVSAQTQAARPAQEVPEDKYLTLEDLNYGGNNYWNMVPQNKYYAWWGDQLVRTDVEECVFVDSETGEESPFLKLEEVERWAGTAPDMKVRHLQNVRFPYPDQKLMLLSNGKERLLVSWESKCIVWRQMATNQQHADWSPSSRAVAFVRDHNLYILDKNGKEFQLTKDGTRELVYGQSVHRDEFGITKGTFWSPDGQRLAFYRMDQSMVTDYPQVNIFQREATYEPDKYPMAGETSHVVTVGIYDMQAKKTIFLKTPQANYNDLRSPDPVYFTNIQWSPDSKTVYMFELNRDQNDCRLVAYNAITGERTVELYHETSDKYVEPLHPIVFLPWDSSKFILQSQRDGYNHLYLYNTEGKLIKQLTEGDFVVMEFIGFNEKEKSIIIASNEKSPIQRNLYTVNIKTGKRILIDNGQGYHRAILSKSGSHLVDNYSEPTVPRVIKVTSTNKKNGKSAEEGTTLFTAADPWKEYHQPIFESGTLKANDGKTDLYYRMVKPFNFDPGKKYPTIIYVYGGPHAHCVDASWHYMSRGWESYMATKGYLLFIIDNRGSENRGRDFEQATFRQLGQVEMQDQMTGVEYLKCLPYVDTDRIGVHGWSFGGFMTISLMTNFNEVFKVGVAGGPVIDWKWYEVMYGERYMDTPQDNPEGYEKTSLINQAKNLKGKLQIITGYNDATVVPQHCLSFIAACIEAGTQPDFMVYPGEPHNMRGRQSYHLHQRISQYFDDYLK
ncbi:MAG: S9 family peptidase [Prevotella sp.]|nr:S9 family peptidase [Prevotella sp.]